MPLNESDEFILLSLSGQPLTKRQIYAALESVGEPLNLGTIYYILRKLAKKNLIVCVGAIPEPRGPHRKLFEISPEGIMALKAKKEKRGKIKAIGLQLSALNDPDSILPA